MDLDTLKREALRLPPEDRARLASELLKSLDGLPKRDADRLWLEEAARRAAQVDSGEVKLVSADEGDRKARALLQLSGPMSRLTRVTRMTSSAPSTREEA
jgi:Putative addiction module component